MNNKHENEKQGSAFHSNFHEEKVEANDTGQFKLTVWKNCLHFLQMLDVRQTYIHIEYHAFTSGRLVYALVLEFGKDGDG